MGGNLVAQALDKAAVVEAAATGNDVAQVGAAGLAGGFGRVRDHHMVVFDCPAIGVGGLFEDDVAAAVLGVDALNTVCMRTDRPNERAC